MSEEDKLNEPLSNSRYNVAGKACEICGKTAYRKYIKAWICHTLDYEGNESMFPFSTNQVSYKIPKKDIRYFCNIHAELFEKGDFVEDITP